MIEFIIKTLDSKNHTFTVSDGCSVAELKEYVTIRLNLPKNRQKLIFMGKVLRDDTMLKDLGVNGKVIHLVETPPPGRENRPMLPRMVSIGTGNRIRFEIRTDRSTNTETNSANENIQTPASTLHSCMRGQMRSITAQHSDNGHRVTHSPTVGRVELVRRLVSEIRISIDELKLLVHQTEQLRELPYEEGEDDEFTNWSNSFTTTQAGRLWLDTLFGEDDSDLPFRYADLRASGNEPSHVMPRDLAILLDELESLNTQFAPYRRRYVRLLYYSNRLNSTNSNAETVSNERIVEITIEILHNFAHAYHAISEISFHANTPVSRLSSEVPIHRPINRNNSGTIFGTGAMSSQDNASGAEALPRTDTACGIDTACDTDQFLDIGEENRSDEACAIHVPAASSPNTNNTTTSSTTTVERDTPIDNNSSNPPENMRRRPVAYIVEIETRLAGRRNSSGMNNLLRQRQGHNMRVSSGIANVFGQPERALTVNTGGRVQLPAPTEGDRNQSGQPRQGGQVYVFRAPVEGEPGQDFLGNILSTAIRRSVETALNRAQNNEEPLTNDLRSKPSQEPIDRQDVQGQQPNSEHGITSDSTQHDSIVNDGASSSGEQQQQQQQCREESAELLLLAPRRRVMIAPDLRRLRDHGCELSDEYMEIIDQILGYRPYPLSWLNDFLVIAARFVFTRDQLSYEMADESHMPRELNAIRCRLRVFARYLSDHSSHIGIFTNIFENITSFIMNSIAEFMTAIVTNARLIHVRSDVDLVLSTRSFLTSLLPSLFSVIATETDDVNHAPNIYLVLGQMYMDILAFIQLCAADDIGLRVVYTMLMAHLTDTGITNITRCLRRFSQIIFNKAEEGIQANVPLVSAHFILPRNRRMVRRRFRGANVENTPLQHSTDPTTQSQAQSNARVDVDVASTTAAQSNSQTVDVCINTDTPVTHSPELGQETVRTSTSASRISETAQTAPVSANNINVQSAQSTQIAQHWDDEQVPVLTGDQNTQRAEQPPFSDNYLTGMPSRKRRRIKQSRPPTNLDGLINENVRDAMAQARSTPAYRAAYREYIRDLAHVRAQIDLDYNPASYRNAATFIQGSADGPGDNNRSDQGNAEE